RVIPPHKDGGVDGESPVLGHEAPSCCVVIDLEGCTPHTRAHVPQELGQPDPVILEVRENAELRSKIQRAVKAQVSVINVGMVAVYAQHKGFGKALADTLVAKKVCRSVGFRKVARDIYQEQRPAADLDIARIGE